MFWEILLFEFRYQLRQPVFVIATVLFFLLTFGAITTDTISIGGAIGSVNRNAPFVIMQILLVMSVLGVFSSTAFVANSTHRDIEFNTQSLFFTTRITKADYLIGRFLGASLAAFLVFFAVVLAIIIGSWMPWLEKDRIGPFTASPYLYSMFVLVLPNLIITGIIFFSLAALTRSMLYTYAGVVGFFVAYAVSSQLLSDIRNQTLASLLDPFALAAAATATRYWTVFEKNSSVLSAGGIIFYNRLVWLGISMIVFVIAYRKFRFTATTEKRKKKKLDVELPEIVQPVAHMVPVTQNFSSKASLQQYWWQTKLEFFSVLKSVPFIVILFLGGFNMVGNASGLEQLFGTPVFPVTHLMLNVIGSAFLLFTFLILTLYSGELTWKERSLNISSVTDALPVRDWILWASKLSTLILVLIVVFLAGMLTTIGIQLYNGYHNLEIGLYFKSLFLETSVPFIQMAILALFLQTMANHKYLGFLLMVLYLVSTFVLPAMHLEHYLYRYAGGPEAPYSDMNGYGHFVKPLFWFSLYWSFVAAILVVIIHLFWVRGSETLFRLRTRIARQRFGSIALTALLVAVIGALLSGAYVFYNTNILNEYVTQDQIEERQAEFEKQYKKYERIPMPRIMDVRADVDIFPQERAVYARGRYLLENKRTEPIETIHININKDLKIRKLEMPGAKAQTEDSKRGYYIYKLARPMNPGDQIVLTYDLAWENHGFVNSRSNTKLVYNGTFFNSGDCFPHLGYSRDFQLVDPSKRKKYGLPPVERLPKLEDEGARRDNALSAEADWLRFETTVSTSSDQTAIAPGYLQKEWVQNGRRYFHYKMDAPILSFWSYLSADYAVKRDSWKDVRIEIYYDKAHPYNVDRMIDATKKSLDYFTSNFSLYQFKQVRILEFPRYARFAQSFPNTIPFSESIGFIARITKPEDIDYVFYVTAHEVAHQWWAHQVIGANVQGSTLLVESMAQYSALMVMEKQYGPNQMRRFLKYELDRYLAGRGGELVEEEPLMRVEGQPYIHYAKGSLVMYALRDYIGEKQLNQALSRFVHDKAFQQPPYTNTREFLTYIAQAVPEDKRAILTDLFETITLYDLKTTEAKSTRRPDGKYDVQFTVEAKKFHADGKGRETEATLNDWIDVGVFGAKKKNGDDNILALEKKQIHGGSVTFQFIVNEPPDKAGIDPLNKLIDRNPDDNTKQL